MSKQPEPIHTPFRIGRRQLLTGLASSGLMLSGAHRAFGQARVTVTGGEAAPLPIAIPNFVAGTPQGGEGGGCVTPGITHKLQRSGLFAPLHSAALIAKNFHIYPTPQFPNS